MSVTNKTIRDLESAAAEAVQAMNELAELLEGGGPAFLRDQRIANRLERLRIAAIELGRAETLCSRERTLTMSEEEMREEFAALGLDWDETTERGHALLQRLLAEYDARREAETAKVAGKLAAGLGVGLEDAHDKLRAGASVDLGDDDERPRSGFKIPDAPAEPQPRGLKLTVLDVPPDTSGPMRVVRRDGVSTHEDDEAEFPDTFVCDVCNREVPVSDMPGACAACWCAAHPKAEEVVEAMREAAPGSVGERLAELAVRPGHAVRDPGESEAEYLSRLRAAYGDAEPTVRRAFVNRPGDNHIDVRVGQALDFVISWRHADPYVSVYAFAWSMFTACSDIFSWLSANPCASRSEVAAALAGLGYYDDTPAEEPSFGHLSGPIEGGPIQVALGSALPAPGETLSMVVIIGYTEMSGHAVWVSDHGMMWVRGVGVGICGRWDMTPKVDAALAKHFEGVEPLTQEQVTEAEQRARAARGSRS